MTVAAAAAAKQQPSMADLKPGLPDLRRRYKLQYIAQPAFVCNTQVKPA